MKDEKIGIFKTIIKEIIILSANMILYFYSLYFIVWLWYHIIHNNFFFNNFFKNGVLELNAKTIIVGIVFMIITRVSLYKYKKI